MYIDALSFVAVYRPGTVEGVAQQYKAEFVGP